VVLEFVHQLELFEQTHLPLHTVAAAEEDLPVVAQQLRRLHARTDVDHLPQLVLLQLGQARGVPLGLQVTQPQLALIVAAPGVDHVAVVHGDSMLFPAFHVCDQLVFLVLLVLAEFHLGEFTYSIVMSQPQLAIFIVGSLSLEEP